MPSKRLTIIPISAETTMIIVQNGKQFSECLYLSEEELEKEVVCSHQQFFGKDTIFINAKKKIGSQSLGNTIPDGFLFDMSDRNNREFYLVEVELAKHDFYSHIFPQVTKFFGFFRDKTRQKELIEWLFAAIEADSKLREAFRKYLGKQEVFKFLSDTIDASQNILLILDGVKPELPEITKTYTDTWGKMVKVITLRRFKVDTEALFVVDPEFATIEYQPPVETGEAYTEEFHLKGVADNVKTIYATLKKRIQKLSSRITFNPQGYYISIRSSKNCAYIEMRKKKIRLVILLPESALRKRIRKHNIRSLSQSVQGFYNNPCAAVDIEDMKNLDEIVGAMKDVIKKFPPNNVEGNSRGT
jgi:predicted transport protein